MPKLIGRTEMDLKAMGDLRALFVAAIVVFVGGRFTMAQAYQQTNLVSDIQGLAQNPPNGSADTQLLNPWGLVSSSTSPWWISDNNAGLSTLYNGQGVKQGLVVNIPSPMSATGGTPTGIVFTGASGFSFQADGKTTGAVFTFVTEDGTIIAWGPGINPQDLPGDAFIVVDNSNNPTAAKGRCSFPGRFAWCPPRHAGIETAWYRPAGTCGGYSGYPRLASPSTP